MLIENLTKNIVVHNYELLSFDAEPNKDVSKHLRTRGYVV